MSALPPGVVKFRKGGFFVLRMPFDCWYYVCSGNPEGKWEPVATHTLYSAAYLECKALAERACSAG